MTLRKKRFLIWAITLWAILSGCLVTDLFVCPCTTVSGMGSEPVMGSKDANFLSPPKHPPVKDEVDGERLPAQPDTNSAVLRRHVG
jgi:hypothetical protein